MEGAESLAGVGEALLVGVIHETEVSDHPAALIAEEVIGLDVPMGDALLMQLS
jgi:hypothetical protein